MVHEQRDAVQQQEESLAPEILAFCSLIARIMMRCLRQHDTRLEQFLFPPDQSEQDFAGGKHEPTTESTRSSQLRPQGETGALGEQVDRCVAYCLEHGYLVPHDQRLAAVQAGSAASDRPALAQLLEAIRQGGAAVVVVRGLDRLARDRAQGFEEFRAAGVSITAPGS